jgi:hypothetical protein
VLNGQDDYKDRYRLSNWEGDIKMEFRKLGYEDMSRIKVAQVHFQ